MQSSGSLSSMPSFENLRRGQRAVVQKFQEMILGGPTSVVAKLPTGYGKTKSAAASFAVLKAKNEVDFMLFVVPRTAQSNQCAESVPEELFKYGIKTKSFDFGDNPAKAHRAVKRESACVFAITVQSLVSKTTLEVLQAAMSIGRWMLVIDEYHHYSINGKWTEWLKNLPAVYTLAMSATPDREDCPSPYGAPDVSVTYRDAVKEFAVKPLSLHSYDYKIDAVKRNGEVISFSISELQSEINEKKSVDAVIASREARRNLDFIAPLILNPIERLNNLAIYGIRSQMIIQALDCSHAKFVCEQVRSIISDGMTVDWVGTGPNGRTDTENEGVLKRFCPPKDENGFRNWTLDILVNVGMAGEGLDTTDVTEIVFLTNPRGTISDRQIMGRAARIMNVSSTNRNKIVGHINVDSGCDLSKFLGSQIMDVFDTDSEYMDEEDPKDNNDEVEKEPNGMTPIEWDNVLMVLNVDLIDIKHDPEYVPIYNDLMKGLSEKYSQDEAERAATKILHEYLNKKAENNKSKNQSAHDESARRQVHAAYKDVARKAAILVSMKNNVTYDSIKADISKKINADKAKVCGRIDGCSGSDFEKHIDYLKALEETILQGNIPKCVM